MGLETVSHIDDLNSSNPTSSDPKSEGDDHIRNIKTALLTDLPHVNAATPLSPTGFDDTNGNEVLIVGTTASAVNEVTVTNAATTNKPSINQTGADDVGIDIEGVELHNNDITTSGVISASGHPSFSAYRAVNYSYTSGNEVIFDTENWDTTSDYDTSNGRFTPSVAGKYHVTASVIGLSTSNLVISLYKNGTEIAHGVTTVTGSDSAGHISKDVDMNGTTDYITVRFSTATVNGTNSRTFFCGHRVGP